MRIQCFYWCSAWACLSFSYHSSRCLAYLSSFNYVQVSLIYICICIDACIYMYVCMYVCMYIYKSLYASKCIYTHLGYYPHTHTHTFIWPCMYIYLSKHVLCYLCIICVCDMHISSKKCLYPLFPF